MNFAKFLDARFQECRIAEFNATKEDASNYPILIDAEIKSIHAILTGYRKFLKVLLMPKIFMDYALVLMHLRARPTTPLLDRLKEQKAEEEAAKQKELEKAARKVGMLESVKAPDPA